MPQALGTLPRRTLKRLHADLDLLIAAMHGNETAVLTPLASL